MQPPSQPVDLQEAYNEMVDVYKTESDRAAAILAGSFIDNTLRELLLAQMVDHSKVSSLFEGDRPLSSFSARISVAFGLGLLLPNVYSDLELIRKIRNHFAHSAAASSFGVSPVRDWCGELSMVKRESEVVVKAAAALEPRNQFLTTIAAITHYMEHMIGGLRNGPLQRCILPSPARLMKDMP